MYVGMYVGILSMYVHIYACISSILLHIVWVLRRACLEISASGLADRPSCRSLQGKRKGAAAARSWAWISSRCFSTARPAHTIL